MRSTISRWPVIAALAALCVMHQSAVRGQTPEQEKLWQEQRAEAQRLERAQAEGLALQRQARKADPMAWVRTLDPMSQGGWIFRAVGTDGSWATFSTLHQLKRSGHWVTVWLRQEFPEPQRSPAGDTYSSDVEKIQYDCAKDRGRILLVIYYAGNNLAGSQQSEESDPKQAAWDPIVPGTQSELNLQWACNAASTGSRP